MSTATLTTANPFALMVEPQRVQAAMARSKSLKKLDNRECHPLDRAVIRSASAELAAWDGKIDRKTVYLAPDDNHKAPIVRPGTPVLV
ncbi:MAG: hypothetical protein KIS62_18060 [Ramlibacter sp.]|nr:hypothetical protein [Ramlibacter sp.]MBX3656842.1 hypothetical protein [Ramlibacter sp.]MCW5651655.1 hypothetical protein [Ramlibacter sp.]